MMLKIFQEVLVAVVVNQVSTLVTPVVSDVQQEVVKVFKRILKIKPEIEDDLKTAKTPEDFERICEKFTSEVNALARSGSIEVEKTVIEALSRIRFDHQNGTVSILGSDFSAPLIQIGGTGSGHTEVSDSVLKSQGAQIACRSKASIKIKGDAEINMS